MSEADPKLLQVLDGLKDRGLLDRVESIEVDGVKLELTRPVPLIGSLTREREQDAEEFDPYASSHGGHDGR